MAFTFIASAHGGGVSGTTFNLGTTLDLQVGDLLVGMISAEEATFTPEIYKSGSPTVHALSFEPEIAGGAGSVFGFVGYKVVTVEESGVTLTGDFNTSSVWCHVSVAQFRPTSGATVTRDDYSGAGGNSASANSGTFDVTGTDALAVAFEVSYASGSVTSHQINGVAADGAIDADNDDTLAAAAVWYRILSSTFTGGAATATVPNEYWICGGISFKATSGSVERNPVPMGFVVG